MHKRPRPQHKRQCKACIASGICQTLPTFWCLAQTLLKTAVLATRKTLDREAPAPKTATQEAMQAQVSSAALQSDTLKASALAAEVSSGPQGEAPQAKQVVLLIHGGAQGGWVWSYPNEVRAPFRPPLHCGIA